MELFPVEHPSGIPWYRLRMVKWLRQFKATAHLRHLIKKNKFTEEELTFLADHLELEPKKKPAKGSLYQLE